MQASVFGDVQLGVDVIADNLMWDVCKTDPLIKNGASEEAPEARARLLVVGAPPQQPQQQPQPQPQLLLQQQQQQQWWWWCLWWWWWWWWWW